MQRRRFLQAALGLPAVSALAATKPLNFIVILVDDFGWADLSCYGSKFHQTPNIDRLAASGIRFTNAYAACPVCSPTRASIMTGKYPARLHLTDWIPGRTQWPTSKLKRLEFEQQLPLAETTIAETLKPLGYATASIGKWHLGSAPYYPEKQGFDTNIGGTDKGSPPSYFPPYKIPGLEPRFEKDYLTDNLNYRAEQWIEQNKDKPFFLYLPHFTVHLPYGAKPEVIEKYKARIDPANPQQNPVYAAMVEGLDDAVGSLVRKLEELKLRDRTVIIFTSDNGGLRYEGSSKVATTSNTPLRAGKGHLYEGGIRVAFIASGPGIPKGKTSDAVISSIDIHPTIADFARAKPQSQFDGVSLKRLFTGGGAPKREAIYWHYPHYSNQGGVPGGAVRQGDWKLIEFYEDNRTELYNLKDDIGETRNLVNQKPAQAAALYALLKRWRTSVNAAMPEANPGYDPEKADQRLTGAEKPTPPQ